MVGAGRPWQAAAATAAVTGAAAIAEPRAEKSSFAGRMGLSGQENLQDLATSAFSGQQSAMGASAAEAQVLASMTYIEMLES